MGVGSNGKGLMRFSKRTNWNTEESGLARAHRDRVRGGFAGGGSDGFESNAVRISISREFAGSA